MNEADDDRPEFDPLLTAVRTFCGIVFGMLPGALIAVFFLTRNGVAVAILGIPIGLAIAFGLAGVQRSLRLLLALLAARNIPFLSEKALEWVDDGSQPDLRSKDASDRLLNWMTANTTGPARGWWVFGGLITGLVGGAVWMVFEVYEIGAGRRGILLPLDAGRDPLVIDAVLVTIALGIWSAAAVGVLVSTPYRRFVLVGSSISGFLSSCIAIGAAKPGVGPMRGIIYLTTLGVAFAMLVAALILTGDRRVNSSPLDAPSSDDRG